MRILNSYLEIFFTFAANPQEMIVMKKITYLCVALLWCTVFYAQSDTNVQQVRIDFKTPEGFIRHLLLGFTQDNSATDGIDYGYDARNREFLADDLNWLINNKRYIIQGVGSFNVSKKYPLGMFITNAGEIEIALDELENFDKPIDVFIYDAWQNSYHLLNSDSYKLEMQPGVYQDRFFMTFNNISSQNLATGKSEFENVTLNYNKKTKTIDVYTSGKDFDLKLFNLQGQLLSQNHIKGTSVLKQIPFTYGSNQVILTVLKRENQTSVKRILIQ